MLRRVTIGACAGVLISTVGGCRSASDGSPAGEMSRVASDLAERTGAIASPLGDAQVAAACADLLSKPLSEASAVKVALLQNASVRESYERLGIARADLLQAGLIANPVFSADTKSFSHGPEIEFGLAQSFVELFFRPLRRRIAEHELCAAQALVTRELVHLVYEVRRALVAVRGADEVTRLRGEALAAVTAARDLMGKLHVAGNVRDSDLSVEEVGAARALMDVDASRIAVRDTRESLGVLLGLRSSAAALTLEGKLPALPSPTDEASAEVRALAASLDLLEAKARIAAALESAGLARRTGFLPSLDLGVVGKRESSDGAWGFGPAISTAIPVFDQGQAKVLAANALARQRCAIHAHLTVEVASAARRVADRAKAMRAREVYLREIYLPLRVRYVNDTVQTFNAMQIGAFDVLDAKEGEADARREHAETLTAAWLARLDLAELLAGSLDREALEAPSLPENAEKPTPPKGH